VIDYEYQCDACGHAWEAQQRLADPALTLCPACGADRARRLVGGAGGHRLRGDGWARDGYSRPRGR
jgi:putative FmdB family regulatory protein